MTRLHSAAVGILVLTAAATSALAQQSADADEPQDEREVEEIVVTGSRTAKAVDKIPGAITIISEEEIDRSLSLTEDLTAVLARSVPGYAESSQALNNLGETLRGRVALRLFDGIPQSTPLRDGSRNGTFTDLGVVSRIEVINGPSASEGIGAAGGIVNYISKSPTEDGTVITLTTRATSQFESDSQTWKVGAELAHRSDAFDVLISGSYADRGITYDSDGRRIGLSASSSVADSESDNLFLKAGLNFGASDEQRLQVTASAFNLSSKGNYHWVQGDRTLGISDTAEPGPPLGTGGIDISGTEFNDFEQFVLAYRHSNLLGGMLAADAYWAEQAMRFPGDNSADRQDPDIAPLGTLVDQSEVHSEKVGLRTSWTRQDIFRLSGLELQVGLDVVEDETEQSLALTNRIWVPPMVYESLAPYLQLSYDIGPVTVSGGVRREDGELSVDDYTTTFFRNRAFVEGGTLDYEETLPNIGAIWRITDTWSVYASYSEGFTLPNIGIPLRNINVPGQSVEGILDLEAIVFENQEIGFNWTGEYVTLGASYYESKSDLGASLSVDPITLDFVLNRAPVEIDGIEVTAEFSLSDNWQFTALYSQIDGHTTFASNPTGPLDREMGVTDIGPDKLAASATWFFLPNANVILSATKTFDRDLNEGAPTNEEHTDGYTLYDLTANYETERFGAFALGIENLTDEFYFLTFSQIDFFRNYFAGRGRTVSLTYSISF